MKTQNKLKNRILLFDLESNGHHPIYIQHLLEYWNQRNLEIKLFLVVSPEFLDKHQKIIGRFAGVKACKIQIISITQAEFLSVHETKSLSSKTFQTWSILENYAHKLKADHCVVMWFDHILQLPLALHRRFPCAISGICFRPMFHYLQWDHQALSFTDRLKAWRQLLLYFSAVRHPQLQNLFCLDPFVPRMINNLSQYNKALPLPEPVEPRFKPIDQIDLDTLKKTLKVEPQRKILLFFGAIAARKGIFELIRSLKQLSPKTCQKITLLLVGEIVHPAERQKIIPLIQDLKDTTSIQIILREEYVYHDDMVNYFALADIILAPYQKHIGMSNILLQAAAAGKPVISANYGLMGRMIHIHELGIATDTLQAQAIAKAIEKALNQPSSELCNQEKMMNWVLENTPEKFSATIMDSIIRAHG